MKILNDPKKTVGKWWEGLTLTCQCSAKFTLEAGDTVVEVMITGMGQPSKMEGFVDCPVCNQPVRFTKESSCPK